MGEIIRLVVDLNIDQVSLKISLMAVSERQMSGKGCSVREGLRTVGKFGGTGNALKAGPRKQPGPATRSELLSRTCFY